MRQRKEVNYAVIGSEDDEMSASESSGDEGPSKRGAKRKVCLGLECTKRLKFPFLRFIFATCCVSLAIRLHLPTSCIGLKLAILALWCSRADDQQYASRCTQCICSAWCRQHQGLRGRASQEGKLSVPGRTKAGSLLVLRKRPVRLGPCRPRPAFVARGALTPSCRPPRKT